MADKNAQNIIIKRVKKVAGGHHGGAWKVAYADFVTAMMAFFLLLWLLNVTTAIQRKGIADYFAPTSISSARSGADGLFGGRTMNTDEAKMSDTAPAGVTDSVENQMEDVTVEEDDPDAPKAIATEEATKPANVGTFEKKGGLTDEELEKLGQAHQQQQAQAAAEQKTFEKATEALKAAIAETPDLLPLSKSLIIDQTEEGLRIQIVDQENYSMFPPGSAQMYPQTKKLLEIVGKAVALMPNQLALTGHTDSSPFPKGATRDNWDLSAERANASRRVLLNTGINISRIQSVVGRADREPYIKENPADPKNRRISIVLLRQARTASPAPAAPAPAAETTPPISTPAAPTAATPASVIPTPATP